jgi:hypothetical protein
MVTSTPDGAEVVVDGVSLGRTPLKVNMREASSSLISIRNGAGAKQVRVPLGHGQEIHIRAELPEALL